MNAATKIAPPTHLDLPETDGLPMQNALQAFQIALLTAVLRPVIEALHPDGRFFIGQDVGIYYRITDPPLNGCKAPDWFYVPDVPRLLEGEYRRTYVLWQEHESPMLVVEFAAEDGAEERDRTPQTGKFWVYERAVHAAYYAIFNVNDESLEVYEMADGRYRSVKANPSGRYPIRPLGVELGVWTGAFSVYESLPWLRAFRPGGSLLATPEEIAEEERRQAQYEHQRAERERENAERLKSKLRELGVDPDKV